MQYLSFNLNWWNFNVCKSVIYMLMCHFYLLYVLLMMF